MTEMTEIQKLIEKLKKDAKEPYLQLGKREEIFNEIVTINNDIQSFVFQIDGFSHYVKIHNEYDGGYRIKEFFGEQYPKAGSKKVRKRKKVYWNSEQGNHISYIGDNPKKIDKFKLEQSEIIGILNSCDSDEYYDNKHQCAFIRKKTQNPKNTIANKANKS